MWIRLTFFSTKESRSEKLSSLPPPSYTKEKVCRGELEDDIFVRWEEQDELDDTFTRYPMDLPQYGHEQLLELYPWLELIIFEESGSQHNSE